MVAAELLAWTMARAGDDHATEFQAASRQCERGVADTLSRIAGRAAGELEPGMWRPVETPAGAILAHDGFERFEPNVDLVGIAVGVQEVVEADAYRVSSLTVGTELPPIWLTSRDPAELECALGRARACVSVDGDLDPTATPTAGDQQLLVFLTEAASSDDARLIARAAVPAEAHESLGLAHGAVCCVVVANSTDVGVPAFERDGSLERFEPPLRSVLEQSRGFGQSD